MKVVLDDALCQGRWLYDDILFDVCDLMPGPVGADVVAEYADGMFREGASSQFS